MTGPTTDPFAGSVIADRFAIRGAIGGGAMGTVYRARHLWLDRDVAIKVLRGTGLAVDGKARRRLHREARSVARISNAHVVQVHDYGETDDGAPFLVMELVAGPTAEQWLAGGTPSLRDVLLAFDGVLAGLAAAHARGVLHRDLKPANMLLRDADPRQVVLVDFGIAAVFSTGSTSASLSVVAPAVEGGLPEDVERLLASERARARAGRAGEERLTREGTVIGTPLYMAPEQALGRAVGPLSDVYAAGVILYEWLSGATPFRGPVMEVMRAHAYEPPPRLRPRAGLTVPPALVELLSQLLAKDPGARPGSAGVVRGVLEPLLSEPGSPSAGRLLHVPTRPRVSPDTIATEARGRTRRVPHPLPWLGRPELEAELSAVGAEVAAGSGRVVLIGGAPGLGKSRLTEEFVAGLEEQGTVWVGRGSSLVDALPHAALRHALEDLLEARSLGRDRFAARLAVALGSGPGGGLAVTEQAALLGWLRPEVGGAPPEPGWEIGLVERALRVLSARRPVVLWLDDLDRNGEDGARVIEQLTAALRVDPFPLLLLATTAASAERAAGARSWAELSRFDGEIVRRLQVGPMTEAALTQLAQQALPLTESAAARVAERAAGSPLVLVHLLRHLVDSPRLVEVGRRLGLQDGDALLDVLPGTMKETLEARIADASARCAAPELAHRVLRAGAALGERFEVRRLRDGLEAMGESPTDDDLDRVLDDLIAHGILREVDDPTADCLRFDHPTMVVALLDSLVATRSGRRLAQSLAARLLAHRDGLDEALAPALVRLIKACGAHHLLPEPAVIAGVHALAAGRLGDAASLFMVATDHGAVGSTRLDALQGAATANQLLGHHESAISSVRALLDGPLPEGSAGETRRARALATLGRSALARGRRDEAAQALQEAYRLHAACLPDPDAAREVVRVASSLARLADLGGRRELPPIDPAALLGAVSAARDRYVVSVALAYLAGRDGEHARAYELLGVALAAARSAGHRQGLVTVLFDLAWTERRLGTTERARAHLRECLALASALGIRPMVARAHNELGELLRAEDDLDGARTAYVEAASLADVLDGPEPLVASLNVALVDALAGAPRRAMERLEAMRAADQVPDWLLGAWTLTCALSEATAGASTAGPLMRQALDAGGLGPDAADILELLAARAGAHGQIALADEARAAAAGLSAGRP